MLKFISLILFINVVWHGQSGKAPIEDLDEDNIFYSTDLITTVTKALKKANTKYLGLFCKGPLT
jgi:hypothetical protein